MPAEWKRQYSGDDPIETIEMETIPAPTRAAPDPKETCRRAGQEARTLEVAGQMPSGSVPREKRTPHGQEIHDKAPTPPTNRFWQAGFPRIAPLERAVRCYLNFVREKRAVCPAGSAQNVVFGGDPG